MINEKIMLKDIIEAQSLRQLQDGISRKANVTSMILNANGEPLSDVVYTNGLCSLFQEKHGDCACLQSIMSMSDKAKETLLPATVECPYIGTTSVSIPIVAEGEYLGAWAIGQVRISDGKVKPAGEIAQLAGINEETVKGFLDSFYQCSAKSFNESIWMISALHDEIVKQIVYSIRMKEKNQSLTWMADSLERSIEALCTFSDAADAYMCMSDYNTGEILMCNMAYAEFYGKTVDEAVGSYCFENNGFVSRCPYCPRLDNAAHDVSQSPTSMSWEHFFADKGIQLRGSSREVRWVDGRLANMSVAVDITRRKQMEDELYVLAFFDQQLQLPNTERMVKDIRLGQVHDYLVAISLTDLRRINNLFDRSCGDMLLQEARDYILALEIPNTVLYRGRFNEFYILFRDTKDVYMPKATADTIVKRLKEAWEFEWKGQNVAIMTGAAACVIPLNCYQEHFISFMFNAIEQCIELARKTDTVIVYDDDVRESLDASQEMDMSLKKAVKQGMKGFYLEYQPIVDMNAAKWKGVEALCRWVSPEFGAVPPVVFIPLAESGGLINHIGMWVLETAVRQIKELKLDLVDGFLLEVNLSPIQFFTEGLEDRILEILERYDYPAQKLGLEITESNELNFSKRNMEAILRLSELGVVVVLDDFGTGYSSFNTLHKLPVKVLKTERSFVSGIEKDKYLRNLLCIMVALAHGSKLQMVAEGVENYAQVEFLLRQGTEFFQGYYFSPPMKLDEVRDRLEYFCYPVEELMDLNNARWKPLNKDDGGHCEEGYDLGNHKLINRCVREVLLNNNCGEAIHKLLGLVGANLHLSRASVFSKGADETFSNINEWCAPGIFSEKDNQQHIHFKEDYRQWVEALLYDEMLVIPDTRLIKKEYYVGLTGKKAKAVIAFPIWKEDILFGFVSYEDYASVRYWQKDDVQTLHTLSSLLSTIFNRMWIQDVADESGAVNESILNSINTAIYVTDLTSNEILFANQEMQRLYGNKPLSGRVCWEAIHEKSERCEFCQIPYLLKNPGKNRGWEYYDENRDKLFRIQDSVIPWVGGKMAHLQYAIGLSSVEQL